jgi:hypothetical protein
MSAALVAAFQAHRACTGLEAERDDTGARIHGACIVCGQPWPCEVAQVAIDVAKEAKAATQLAEALMLVVAEDGIDASDPEFVRVVFTRSEWTQIIAALRAAGRLP